MGDREERFRRLIAREAPPTRDELADLYDQAEPIDLAFLHGEWNGGLFGRDHPIERYLESIRWAGKTFRAPTDVDPIVCFADDGSRVARTWRRQAALRKSRTSATNSS